MSRGNKIFTKKERGKGDPQAITNWIASHPPKSEKDGEIELKRLSIEKVHYLFLAVWFIISFFAGRAMMLVYTPNIMLDTVDKVAAYGLSAACICFAFFSLLSAKQHSKQFDANILNVFSYMIRQDKRDFSYRKRGKPEYEREGRHVLQSIIDENEDENTDVSIKIIKAPNRIEESSYSSEYFPKPSPPEITENISDIEEVIIGNQSNSPSSPVYLKKNNKIRQMLLSDRSQLIAFVAMYNFAMLAGGILGYVL